MDDDFSDSGVDTDFSSDLESITSSLYQFKTVNGRTYHGIENNPYPLPNDPEEIQRLDALHWVCNALLGGTILAPIRKRPSQIVDMGCGAGLWAIEVAERYPNATIFGIDLSPIQPTLDIPENCDFIVSDITEGLEFINNDSADLVHSRIIQAGVRKEQWLPLMREAYRMCKPGIGWAQIVEAGPYFIFDDNIVPLDAPVREHERLKHKIWEIGKGVFCNPWVDIEKHVRAAGFIDVVVRIMKFPCGIWPEDPKLREIGRIARRVFLEVVDPITEAMSEYIPNSEDRATFAKRVKEDIENDSYRLFVPMYDVQGSLFDVRVCVLGRKPPVAVNLSLKGR